VSYDDTGQQHLRIAIVGGIFGFPEEYQSRVPWTPETVLANGLRSRGHDVATLGHDHLLDASKFDIIHVHHLARGAVRAATDGSRTPFVFTLHESAPEHHLAASFVMRRADGIVALTSMEVEAIRRAYATDGATITAIPNGIDPAAFPFRQPKPPATEPWRLLFVGQLHPIKGVSQLLQALVELRQRFSIELELRYHVALDEDFLRARTDELRLADIVCFAGPANQSDLSQRYWAAHLVVLPSLSEALPSVLTEAMLSGSYPVATNVGGISEQLGEFGVLIRQSDSHDIVEGIARAIDTYGAHCKRAARMRTYAESKFSVDAMVSSHEALYWKLCRSRVVPRRHRGGGRLGTFLGKIPLGFWTGTR
jgi:glycosyltransferase involved in cell wall biosynthesis